MDAQQYKDVISKAIQSEIDARTFYEGVAAKIKDDYLKKLFADFAKEEKKHETILTGILNQEKHDARYFDFEKDFKVAETVDMPEVTENMDLKSALGLAMKNEEAAMKQYTSLAENCSDPELRAVFMDLASMERGHKNMMEDKFVNVAFPEVW